MSETVGSLVKQVRAKNAGPFWVTIDIFCGTDKSYQYLNDKLAVTQIAAVLQQPVETIKRFDIPSLHVIKFSLPRPVVQGHRSDRDMHGAQWAVLIEEMDV